MSDNKLKIDVVLADVGESGAVLSDFVTQDLHNTDMAKKADLVNGKVNPTQLPEFSELSGVTDKFSQLENNLREDINISLTESKEYADSIVSVVMSKKADLVNGRVPKEQATNFKDIPGAKAAIDGLKQSLGQEIIGISNSLENNFAKLTNGKVSQTVLPTNLVYTDRLTREMNDVKSALQNTITQVGEELTALETKTNNKFISKTEAEYFTKDIELKAAIDGLEQKSYTAYASKIVETSKADLTYVDRALGALSTAATKFYPTLALANADITNLTLDQPVQVGEVANGGLWYKATAGATTLTKSPYDPLAQAKGYTEAHVEEKTGNITSQIIDNNEAAFSIEDSNNKIALKVRNDGMTEIAKLEVKDELIVPIVNSNLNTGSSEVSDALVEELEITDVNDKIAFAIKADGTTEVAKLNAKELLINNKPLDAGLNVTKLGIFRYNITHFECLGQSLSLGTNGSPILTPVQKYDNLMFVGGLRKQHPNNTSVEFFSSMVPLIEAFSEDTNSPYIYGETPVGGATEQIKELIKSENRVNYTQQNYQLLGTASGEGGKRIHELRDTYVPNNLFPAITAAYNLAQASGKTYGMSAITFVHGEADNATPTTIAQYKTTTLEVLAMIDAHVKATNGQTEDVKLITSQLASFGSATTWPKIELALYQLAMENPNKVFMACPLYIFDYTDSYHLNNVGSKWLGAYLGLTYKRVVIDGEDWKPVHPISHVKQGRVLEVKFHVPVQPLVFDTNQVAKNTDTYGFSLVDNTGAAIAIESVIVTQPDTVKFVTAALIPVGSKLRYAWTPVARPNRTTGPRGNLRDSQGDSIIFDESGINKRMDNWCPIFEYAL